ncbi:hypothetical protein ccrud_03825 [Corynebacterium crudilactis]|uniref:Uncharacterized protein n=1 Tax=Corynebacterium crudilactis TaxID=1652495 RepID=A0A172QRX5_9CORY|nr:hypothetical protein ccrud_03825 [Corynebacterium crudilactis]
MRGLLVDVSPLSSGDVSEVLDSVVGVVVGDDEEAVEVTELVVLVVLSVASVDSPPEHAAKRGMSATNPSATRTCLYGVVATVRTPQ